MLAGFTRILHRVHADECMEEVWQRGGGEGGAGECVGVGMWARLAFVPSS